MKYRPKYECPECGDSSVLDYDGTLECANCRCIFHLDSEETQEFETWINEMTIHPSQP